MKIDEVLKKAGEWLPLAWRLYKAFSGDKRAALIAIRKIELDARRARDRRMGRG